MADPVSSPHPSTYPTPQALPPPSKLSSATPTSIAEPPAGEQPPPPAAPRQDAHPPAGRQPAPDAAGAAELARLQVSLQAHVRRYPDFPAPGILFEDIFPLFRSPQVHADLLRALELFVGPARGGPGAPDVVVGLDARGFLFGPSLALRLGAGFAPVRKPGKLPGATERVSYVKEYGADHFEIQRDAVRPGQTVLVVDDLMATGTFGPIPFSQFHVSSRGGAHVRSLHRTEPFLLVPLFGPLWARARTPGCQAYLDAPRSRRFHSDCQRIVSIRSGKLTVEQADRQPRPARWSRSSGARCWATSS